MQAFFQAANNLYLARKELWEVDFGWEGFQWLEADDANANTVSFLRKDKEGNPLVILCNFSPIHRQGYRVGAPFSGKYEVLLNSDDAAFGGAGRGDKALIASEKVPCHGQEQSITVDLPPMSGLILRCARKDPVKKAPAKKSESSAPKGKTGTAKKSAPKAGSKAKKA